MGVFKKICSNLVSCFYMKKNNNLEENYKKQEEINEINENKEELNLLAKK